MNSNEYVIHTEGLSKSFGEVQALKSLDLRVSQKSIFAFLGPNGAGKTTIFVAPDAANGAGSWSKARIRSFSGPTASTPGSGHGNPAASFTTDGTSKIARKTPACMPAEVCRQGWRETRDLWHFRHTQLR